MIQLSNIHFVYSPKDAVFNGLNLQLEAGNIYGLLGKNGAGKTTLLKVILGLIRPSTGSAQVAGYNPTHRKAAFNAQYFYVPEDPFFPTGSLQKFVKCYAPFYPNFELDKFFGLLNEFEIDRSMSFKNVSFGQKKKAFIAFAIACQTPILIMDEPTNGLDIPSKKQFRKIMNYIINPNRLMIISSHQIRDLHSLIDHVLLLDDGQLLIDHSLQEIEQNLRFEIYRSEPTQEDLIYYERVPGGYLGIRDGVTDHTALEIDLEILFNATIDRPDHMKVLLHKSESYA
jgi:ABC-2 type transport system ATP-binding protein